MIVAYAPPKLNYIEYICACLKRAVLYLQIHDFIMIITLW